jgi:hypothetical protein
VKCPLKNPSYTIDRFGVNVFFGDTATCKHVRFLEQNRKDRLEMIVFNNENGAREKTFHILRSSTVQQSHQDTDKYLCY